MTNKKVVYGLLVGVAIVWGIIGYRVWSASMVEELPFVQKSFPKREYVQLINHEDDQAVLNLNYRDPFSENNADFVEDVTENKLAVKTAMPTLPMIKAQVNWSAIQYTGYINNPDTKLKVVLINLNGKELMLAEGQSLNGLKLLKYAGDSVKIQYQNESTYIKLK